MHFYSSGVQFPRWIILGCRWLCGNAIYLEAEWKAVARRVRAATVTMKKNQNPRPLTSSKAPGGKSSLENFLEVHFFKKWQRNRNDVLIRDIKDVLDLQISFLFLVIYIPFSITLTSKQLLTAHPSLVSPSEPI